MSSRFYQALVKLNLYIRHHDLREHWVKKAGGRFPDKQFFRISYEDRHAGLFGIADRVLGACMYAKERGLIPVVALTEEDIQYRNQEETDSPWEVFYQPVSPYKAGELSQFSKVLYMGYNSSCPRFIRDEIFDSKEKLHEAYEVLCRYARLSYEAKNRLNLERERLNLQNALGVFLRGTDYAALRPSRHSIQPTVEQAIPVIEEYLKDHPDTDTIYLVTEDEGIYRKLRERFGDMICMTGDRFIQNYDGKGLIADYIEDVNEQGFEYLLRIYLLAECKALIGGPAAGASFARIINDGHYEYVYIFDLGRYE